VTDVECLKAGVTKQKTKTGARESLPIKKEPEEEQKIRKKKKKLSWGGNGTVGKLSSDALESLLTRAQKIYDGK